MGGGASRINTLRTCSHGPPQEIEGRWRFAINQGLRPVCYTQKIGAKRASHIRGSILLERKCHPLRTQKGGGGASQTKYNASSKGLALRKQNTMSPRRDKFVVNSGDASQSLSSYYNCTLGLRPFLHIGFYLAPQN